MKVYKIRSGSGFQGFSPYVPGDPQGGKLVKADILMGSDAPKKESWDPLPLSVDDPTLPRGDFARLHGFGGFAVSDRAREALSQVFENTCELLPFLPLDGEIFWRMNVLERVDCLDKEKTRWAVGKFTSVTTGITEYQFDRSRFTGASLFKLPKQSALLTVTGLGDSGSEFKSIIERDALTGLIFEEIWSDGGSPIKITVPFSRE